VRRPKIGAALAGTRRLYAVGTFGGSTNYAYMSTLAADDRRDRILESFSISRESATWSPDGKQLLGAGACGLIAIDLKSRKGRFGAGPASAWGWQPLLPAAPRAPAGSAMSTSSLCETS
jgi:hypothetical protein